MHRSTKALVLVLLAASHSAIAQERMPLTSLKVGPRELTFNVTMTLAKVAGLLGRASVNERGDASTSLHWLCYRATTKADTTVVIIESSEMGGGTLLTSFSLFRPGGDASLEQRCAPLDVPPASIVTDRGVRLGLPRAEVEQLLGPATKDSAGITIYDWFRQRRGRFGNQENVTYSEGSSLWIWYRAGVVVRVYGDRMDIS